MGKYFEQKVKELKEQKKPEEKIKYIPEFNAVRKMFFFVVIAVLSFLTGRALPGNIVIMVITNIISMWMMVYLAQTLIDTQESCIIITDKRIYGRAGKEINLSYYDIVEIINTQKGIFIRANDQQRSVMIRNLSKKNEVFRMIGIQLQRREN